MNSLTNDFIKMINRIETEDAKIVNSDPHRLKFHIMPPVGWLNDPNGLCFYKGLYHVFYQYSPFDAKGSEKFWGHYTSPDMLNWTKEPVFLCPDETFDIHGVYSGSAIEANDNLYLFYTGNVKENGDFDYVLKGREHNTVLAVSKDGIHVDKKLLLLKNKDYPQNMTCHVRDPKVFFYDNKYYMVLGGRTNLDKGIVLVYESDNLTEWKYINTITTDKTFGYMWECPDLFCIDGQFILSLSPQGVKREGYKYQNVYSCGYFPLYGDFRGEYTLGEYIESDFGFDYYAPQSFLSPAGKRIIIGWLGMPDADYFNPGTDKYLWQHCLSIPRELHWNNNEILSTPVEEFKELRCNKRSYELSGISIDEEICESSDIEFTDITDSFTISIRNSATISYDRTLFTLKLNNPINCGRTERFIELDHINNIRLVIDTSSLEIFINNGSKVMSTRFYSDNNSSLKIAGSGKLSVYDIKPMTFS